MRPQTACITCRNRRRKCEVSEIGSTCHYCATRGINCSLSIGRHEDATPSSSLNAESRQAEIIVELPPKAVCIDLVDLYFRYVHDTFHSLFHRPTFMADMSTDSVPPVLLYAIIALSARFSNHEVFIGTDRRTRGIIYAEESNRLLDLRDVSLTTIQACVLLGAFYITEGQAGFEAVYYGTACRIALVLDLSATKLTTWLEQEINTRVWSSLCMIDVWSSTGLRIPRSMPKRLEIPLPIDERTFLLIQRGSYNPSSLEQRVVSNSSLLAQMVRLNGIFELVDEVNHSAVENAHDDAASDHLFENATEKLDHWIETLPDEMRDTQANLARYGAENLGHIFVAVYLGYYHYGQLLYYRFLHEACANSIHAPFYANKCKEYAIGLCEILYRAYSTPGCEVLYSMVGHVLVIASTVQLHILLFDAEPEHTRAARLRLEKNFEILTNLQVYWQATDVCFSRFQEFHRACLKSTQASFQVEKPFRMDKWMLRFLSDFARPIDVTEREEIDSAKCWSFDDVQIGPFSNSELA